MPTTLKPYVIGIKNTNLSAGEYVKVTNFTSGGTLRGKVNSSGEVVLNPENSGLTWVDGDSIIVESTGRIVFSATATLGSGGAKITSTASTADDSPAVSL